MNSPILKPRIYLSSPHMGADELPLVQEAFATNWIAPVGPQVDAFEREFACLIGGQTTAGGERRAEISGQTSDVSRQPSGALQAAALATGTAALHLAMRWLNLQPGDEVLCSSLTFSASVNPVLYERATPVFVDSDDRSWNMDPALLAEAIAAGLKRGKKPKAVILVHLYGQSADIDPIAALCAEHDIPLIEDAAEALGATYWGNRMTVDRGRMPDDRGRRTEDGGRRTEDGRQTSDISRQQSGISPGTVGLCGIYSFNGNKIITTSGGGMLVSANRALIEKARFWATQARDPAPHYQHSEVGFNYRMSNVLAAIGRGQLRVLEQRVDARRRNCAYYQEALKDLPGLSFMPEADYGRCTRWLTCITIDPKVAGVDREQVRLAMEKENIEARPVWKPMHLQPIFKDCLSFGGAVSARLFDHGLCLPSGSNLVTTDLDRVIEVIRKTYGR